MALPAEFSELLSEAERDDLRGIGHPLPFETGELLLSRGDAADRVLVLQAGRVKVVVASSAGTDAVLAFRGPGALLGEQALVDAKPRSANVIAVEPVQALVVAGSVFRAYLERRPRVMMAMLEMLSGRLRYSDGRLVEFAAADALARIAARLVELCDVAGRDLTSAGGGITVPISQEELAGWSATSIESTARSLRLLRTLGWISTGRRVIEITDLKALRSRAC